MAGRFQTRSAVWRINQNIRAPRLRVIGADGRQLGIFSLSEALVKAQEDGLDVVEIAPNAKPPVAKIIDFTKFKYHQEKKEREAKLKEKKGTELKEIWLTPFMAGNDYAVRLGRIKEFLSGGHKVRVAVRFTGRQMGHREFGYDLAKRVEEDTDGIAKIDQPPKMIGRQLLMTITPVKGGKKEIENEKEKTKN